MKNGDRVMIARDNDNENYNDFRDMVLVVINAKTDGIGYDECMFPEKLMDFIVEETGENLPFSLYEYEVEEIDEYGDN